MSSNKTVTTQLSTTSAGGRLFFECRLQNGVVEKCVRFGYRPAPTAAYYREQSVTLNTDPRVILDELESLVAAARAQLAQETKGA